MNGAVSTLNKARHSPISFNSPSMFNSPNLHPPNLPRASFIINSKPSNGPKTLGNTTIPEVLNLVSLPCKPSFSHHFPIIFPWKQPHFLLLSDTPGAPAPYCKGSGGNGKPWLIAKAAKAWRYWLSSKKLLSQRKKWEMRFLWDLNGIWMGFLWDLNGIWMRFLWDLNGIWMGFFLLMMDMFFRCFAQFSEDFMRENWMIGILMRRSMRYWTNLMWYSSVSENG